MHRIIVFIACLLMATPALAATYYVDADPGTDCAGNYSIASRNCSGSDGTSYNTIGEAENAAQTAGDIVYIREGTYVENVTCGYSGSAVGGYITFAAYPGEEAFSSGHIPRGSGNAIVDGKFTLTGRDYIKIIGLEIKQSAANQGSAIELGNSDYIQILDNYIHHNQDDTCMVRGVTNASTYITIRGNYFYYGGCGESSGDCNGNSCAVGIEESNHVILEHNKIQRVGDAINNYRTGYSYIRNNYVHDYSPTYWANIAARCDAGEPTLHADFFQSCGASCTGFNEIVIDGNMWSNYEYDGWGACFNSHFIQARETVGSTASDLIVRGNVLQQWSSGHGQFGGVDYVYVHNNTAYDSNKVSEGGGSWIRWNTEASTALNGVFRNNILHTDSNSAGTMVVSQDAGNVVDVENQICYGLPSTTNGGCVSTGDPQFVDASSNNFSIANGSPAQGSGTSLTLANGDGTNSTSLVVDDTKWFQDGMGMTDADTIIIGSGLPVKISSIDSATEITLSAARSWSDNDPVVLAQMLSATAPDIGALPYRAGGFGLTATYTNSGGTVTVTPSDTSLVRFVVVYEDNIPSAPDYDSPYTFSVGSGVIKAQVYALYASSTPVITADSGAPSISSPIPSGNQACTGATQSVTLGVTTSESATCKHDTNDHAYDVTSGVTFTTTGGTSHSGVTTLASNASYIFYATCIDVSGNTNTSGTQIYFNINECSSGGQGAVIGTGTGAVKTVAPSTPGSGVFRIQ